MLIHMKSRYGFLAFVLILLTVTAAGCPGGGGGGGSSRHAPVLSGLSLYPNSVNQYDGNGTIQVNFYFDFTDAGGDLASMTVTVYDDKGTVLVSDTGPIEGASGITAGYMYGYLSADTQVAGNYTIEFMVTDSAGSESNKIASPFTIIPPASVVSIAVAPMNQGIMQGSTQQFTATATFSDNTVLNITSQATWTSSDTAVATIDSTGLAAGMSHGSTTITATFGGVSGFATLTVAAGFAPGANYPLPSAYSTSWLGNTALGDLNGDGRNDVAALEHYGTSTHIFIYFQNTDHTLGVPQVITTDLALTGIVIADADNDGLAELIVSGNSTIAASPLGRIYVYKQDPATHVLGAPQQYTLSTDNVVALAVADLNNDTLPDIVTTGTGTGTNGVVSFLFQGANGALGSEATYTSVPVYAEGEVHVADMNNDGLNDVVLQSGVLQLAVIKQVSAGSFSTTPDYYAVTTNYWPNFNSFALGDLNGDGRMDVAVADLTGNLNIFLQNNSGQLTGPTMKTLSSTEIHIADIDGDGLNDIISLNGGRTVQILYQAADHGFPAANLYTYLLPTQSSGGTNIHQALSIGDVTGDGLADIVASWLYEGIFVLPRLP
jgi:hypothetical protein